jgi:hypothetical protein
MFGNCDEDRISTSHIERFNLAVRVTLRRFTRLTNGHSKSLRHRTAMQGQFMACYTLARKHETPKRATPAMTSGLSDRVWTIKELIGGAAEACMRLTHVNLSNNVCGVSFWTRSKNTSLRWKGSRIRNSEAKSSDLPALNWHSEK